VKNKMGRNQDSFIVIGLKKKEKTKFFYYIFFAIIVFLCIYMPFFGMNLRFQTESFLRKAFEICGTWILTIGGIMALLGFIGIFAHVKGWATMLLIGGIMIWIGSWLTGAPFTAFDIFFSGGTGGSASGGGGYH
jgi:hypothetical protein